MNIAKYFWGIRALLYKYKLGKVDRLSYIGKPILISHPRNLKLGQKCRIYPGLRVEIVNDNSYITIGNNVSIGQNFHIVSYNNNLHIGSDVTISGNVLITNCDHAYQQIGQHILEQPLIENETEIGDGCFIGYGAVIQAGTKLGKQCIVGANSVVKGVFPDYSVIVGAPGRVVKHYDIKLEQWSRNE